MKEIPCKKWKILTFAMAAALLLTVIGVGYKAAFYGDEKVLEQVAGYGYTLWLGEDGKKLSASKDGAFVSGEVVTARVQNFDVENYGEAKVNGAVFIKLLDGTVIESSIQSFTLRDLIEKINGQIDRFTDAQLLALKAMCKQFQNAMKDWNIANILGIEG